MNGKRFTLGSFNLLNLLLPNKPFYGRQGYHPDLYRRKITWIGQQLDLMKADIVGFQEVFHAQALGETLQLSQHLKDANYIVAAPNGELPRVALATQFDIKAHRVIEAFPEKLDLEGTAIPLESFSRPILRAEVVVNPKLTLIVYVVHLKSKRPLFNEGESRKDPIHLAKGQARALVRRGVEAAALRQLLIEDLAQQDHPLVLLGDVNDSGQAVTTRMLSGEPPHRRFPMEVKHKIWDTLLYHAKDIQARRSYHDFYFTHIHNGHHDALDHIMVSQELVRENPKHVASIGYVKLFNDHLIDETLTNEKVHAWQSDHGQVVATVEMRKHPD